MGDVGVAAFRPAAAARWFGLTVNRRKSTFGWFDQNVRHLHAPRHNLPDTLGCDSSNCFAFRRPARGDERAVPHVCQCAGATESIAVAGSSVCVRAGRNRGGRHARPGGGTRLRDAWRAARSPQRRQVVDDRSHVSALRQCNDDACVQPDRGRREWRDRVPRISGRRAVQQRCARRARGHRRRQCARGGPELSASFPGDGP